MGTRIAILASGSGSTAQALIDASRSGGLSGGEVVILGSDREDAGALERARQAGIEALFVDPDGYADRDSYCEGLGKEMASRDVEWVCLAGFMKILKASFITMFPGRILNTHPALLPAFPGAHPVRDTIAWGAKVTGATVHLVDEQVDHGPILLQEAVAVEQQDDEASLHEKIKQIERRLYPQAVSACVSGRVKIIGRKAVIE